MYPSTTVALCSAMPPWAYPASPPFLPGETYPELSTVLPVGGERNITYALVRQVMLNLGLDTANYSESTWNPLGEIISPGQKVLIKPNLVHHLHLAGGRYDAVVTHGSLVRCILDYAALALKGEGEITVGDSPIQSADFSKTVKRMTLEDICYDVASWWHIPVRLVDFRLRAVRVDSRGRVIQDRELEGDGRGYFLVNLGEKSLLTPLSGRCELFRVTNYDCKMMMRHHNESTHEYVIPRSVLDADVILNLPKLKTHRKAGLTAALKNIVGINGHKDCLPHHRFGSRLEGGDEYDGPALSKRLKTRLAEKIDSNPNSKLNGINRLAARIVGGLARRLAPDHFFEGSWYGNDTIWRTVLDLNRLLVYADRDGVMTEVPQRKCLNIVDAIVAGEAEGPLEPDARPCGFLAGGINPIAVDAVLAALVGFDYRKIPSISKGFGITEWPLIDFGPEEIEIISKDGRLSLLRVDEPSEELCFKPSSGWLGHIESAPNRHKGNSTCIG